MKKQLNILISGGGTGGHIFPALSIAEGLKHRLGSRVNILFVGAQGRMEMERVPAAGYPIEGLPVAGFDRKHPWRNFAVLLKLYKSMRMARGILRSFKPDMAVGVGGYASGPMLKAAQKAGIPTLIQEQNSFAGVTNKLLAKEAKAICTAYPGMERFFPADRIILTGNPVREALLGSTLTRAQAKTALGYDPSKPLLLVVGGSLGARTVNQAVAAAVNSWAQSGIQVMWQTGKIYIDEYQPVAERLEPSVKAMPFISDMATAYRAADLVVARAGAGTISELELLGKAAVLIPSPNVAEDHQRHNAEALATRDAAVMILDADAVAQLKSTVEQLIHDPKKLEHLGANCAKLALHRSADQIVDQILKILNVNDGESI